MRKTTELEAKLINSGYHISSKEYGGWRNLKTKCYIYKKENENNDYLLYLNKKRTKVESVVIHLHNGVYEIEDSSVLLALHNEYHDLLEEIKLIEKGI